MPIGNHRLTKGAREYTRAMPVSFETGEQVSGFRIISDPTSDYRIAGVDYEVVKALAGTDPGTIDIKTPGGTANAITQISIPASSALGTRGSAVPTTIDVNLRGGPNQPNAYHELTNAKATAGGKVMLQIHYRKIAKGSAQG